MLDKKKKLLAYLYSFLTEDRQKKIKKNLLDRTRYITVILEDMYQSHNVAAVMRSCDALGVQDVHCIEHENTLEIKRNIAMGASKWLTVSKYRAQSGDTKSATLACIQTLKAQGYTIVATSPHGKQTLNQLPLDSKIALMFGTEDEGLTKEALDAADQLITIPMYGFVESFNVSVSVALCLYDSTMRLRSSDYDWKLSEEETAELELIWLKAAVERGDILEREFYKK
jgi:tRNA (guanosine-2'-O-)-methyltransferase